MLETFTQVQFSLSLFTVNVPMTTKNTFFPSNVFSHLHIYIDTVGEQKC